MSRREASLTDGIPGEKKERKPARLRIGVDTGGTFTDIVVWREGRLFNRKLPSTPSNPSLAIIAGIRDLLGAADDAFVVHGTTVGTNSLLEKKGGPIALLATAGFEDVIFIGRQTRRELYSLEPEDRHFLLPRELAFGLRERVLAGGRMGRRLEPGEVRRLLPRLSRAGVEAVAVCFLHSYANAANEEAAARELEAAGLMTSVSSRILAEHREYERMTVTAVNAYLMPVMRRYLRDLAGKVGRAELRIMQSNEGHIPAETAMAEPIRTALSGPAGGVVGAMNVATAAGFRNIISFDMGGTSTDVSLVEGRVKRTNEARVGDFPIRIPVIDIHSVGAGGGSIAYADSGGSLRVGPRSAGAEPGPACYGRGDLPTVTDANVLLGRIFPDYFLGGRMKIDPARSRAAMDGLARRIGKSVLETALGIISIANANMEKAIRVISVERGHDPREFALFSFGGAGGMHAAEMAADLGVRTVIVPRNAGVLSAFGLLLADSVKDYVRSLLKTDAQLDPASLERAFRELEAHAFRELSQDGFGPDDIRIERSLDCRYLGQSYEINVPCGRAFGKGRLDLAAFHRLHAKTYSYQHPGRPVEVVNIRVKAVGLTPKVRLEREPLSRPRAVPAGAEIGRQELFAAGARMKAPVFDRLKLLAGNELRGPALVVDAESTTYIPAGFRGWIDGFHNIIMSGAKR
jgi:N-methylhydantoinase A/oxoprolinase/acetone carboxylase beta subunit